MKSSENKSNIQHQGWGQFYTSGLL